MSSTLYIVATPIGNMEDITLRALRVLSEVDVVLCEDTRVTKKLLSRHEISVQTMSYHQHSSQAVVSKIVGLLAEGKNIALVTDAGTPGISDPGNQLVAQVVQEVPDTTIVPVPGASAVVTALSIAGLPTDKFLFLGFPPHKKGRETYFERVGASDVTTVFYESNHRIKKAIGQLAGVLGEERQVVILRELTKKFETVYRGSIKKISEMDIAEKGEFVVVVGR